MPKDYFLKKLVRCRYANYRRELNAQRNVATSHVGQLVVNLAVQEGTLVAGE